MATTLTKTRKQKAKNKKQYTRRHFFVVSCCMQQYEIRKLIQGFVDYVSKYCKTLSSFRRLFLFHNASYTVCISQVERLKVVCLSNCQNCQLPYVRSNSSPESLFRGQEEERPWEIVAVRVFTQQQHPPPQPSLSEASSLATFVLINLYMWRLR